MRTKNLLAAVLMLWVAPAAVSAQCSTVSGDTAYVTVSASCNATVAAAVSSVTSDAACYAGGALQKHVVIEIAADAVSPSISLDGFNASGNGSYRLFVRPVRGEMPVIGTVNIANSRDVTLEGLRIRPDAQYGVRIDNSVSIELLGNDIRAERTATAVPNLDAAVLVSRSDSVRLTGNAVRAPHATLLGATAVNYLLAMNNIFWSDNTNTDATYHTAFVRLGGFGITGQTNQNIGIYYNTLYLAPGSNTTRPVDFLALGHYGNASQYNEPFATPTIRFMYNNCYSYSEQVSGRSAEAFYLRTDGAGGYSDALTGAFCSNVRSNNYWSKYDAAQSNTSSVFAPGCDGDLFVAASLFACATAPTSPGQLQVTGTGLNSGYSPLPDMGVFGQATTPSTDWNHTAAVRPRTGGAPSADIYTTDWTSMFLFGAASGATATHEVDVTGLHLTSGTTLTFSVTGTGASAFSVSPASLTADASGEIATSSVTVTYTAPATPGESVALLHFAFADPDDDLDLDIPLLGVHNGETLGTGWTLGAIQQGVAADEVTQIVWQGKLSSDWDVRENWYFPAQGRELNCADVLSSSLSVVIPSATSFTYPMPEGGRSYAPVIPTFTNTAESRPYKASGEQVDASGSKFASVIDVEYGAALHGVENLSGHYDYAVSHLTVGRGGWVLVGPVVKPFESGTSGEVRSAMSSDFYLNNLPHVYMHEALIEEGTASWGQPFSSMYETVDPTRAFAIRVPNEYGAKRLPDWYYYRYTDNQPAKLNDGSVDKTFTFTGKFCNDAALPTYSGLTAGTAVMLCNTYPANIDPTQLPGGTVQIYNYSTKSFGTPGVGDEILSQHGFVYTPTSLTVPAAAFTSSGTSYRRAPIARTAFFVKASNDADGVSSQAGFRLADKDEDAIDWNVDAPKVFNSMEEALPDLYVVRYGKTWQRVDVPFETESIPLGIRMGKASNIRLEAANTDADMLVTLEDRLTGETYDLSAGEVCEVSDLEAGTSEGRFYLQLAPAAPTSVIEAAGGEDLENSIDIFQNGRMLTISASHGLSLQWLELYDMSGRMVRTELGGGQLQRVAVSVAPGIYVARVVAGSEEKKVKLFIK